MADFLTVTIDVEQLRRNFTAAEGRECTADDVMEWLRDCGFRYQGRTWLCEEMSLRALAPGEYRIVGEQEAAGLGWFVAAISCLVASVFLLQAAPPVGIGLALAAMGLTFVGAVIDQWQADT